MLFLLFSKSHHLTSLRSDVLSAAYLPVIFYAILCFSLHCFLLLVDHQPKIYPRAYKRKTWNAGTGRKISNFRLFDDCNPNKALFCALLSRSYRSANVCKGQKVPLDSSNIDSIIVSTDVDILSYDFSQLHSRRTWVSFTHRKQSRLIDKIWHTAGNWNFNPIYTMMKAKSKA